MADCRFCALTPQDVEKMTEEEAHEACIGANETSCLMHLIAWIHIRKMTSAMGRDLLGKLVNVQSEEGPNAA
jgi:hypothetical protein